jgi:hypothetical protein
VAVGELVRLLPVVVVEEGTAVFGVVPILS